MKSRCGVAQGKHLNAIRFEKFPIFKQKTQEKECYVFIFVDGVFFLAPIAAF